MQFKRFVRRRLLNKGRVALSVYLIWLLLRNRYVSFRYFFLALLELIALERFSSAVVSSTGVLILFVDSGVYKFPLSKLASESLAREFASYEGLKCANRFRGFVDYNLLPWRAGYLMDALTPIDECDYREAVDFFSSMWLSSNVVDVCSLKDSVFKNLDCISSYCGVQIEFPSLGVCVSPMHGDFTSSNIMRNSAGSFVLIDLDRFQFFGIDFVDRLHFMVVSKSLCSGDDWFVSVRLLLGEGCQASSLYIYSLFRVSAEYRVGVYLGARYYDSFVRLTEYLKAAW